MAGNTSFLMNIEGEWPVNPEIRVSPTAQRTVFHAALGWTRRRRYTIQNTNAVALEMFPYAIDFGATDALVTGGQIQASGNDIRVLIDGLEVPRTLNTMNSATSLLIWFIIPNLGAGESMTVEVIYGNPAAGSPPTLMSGIDAPAFDIVTTGVNRSTNTSWRYLVDQNAGNAGLGGWWLSSGTAQPEARQTVPGSWETDVLGVPGVDDCWQLPYSMYTASGTKYNARFDARRARRGVLVPNPGSGADGVSIEVAAGIVSMSASFRYTNLYAGDTNLTPIGKFVILTRNNESDVWQTLFSQSTYSSGGIIGSATYTPTSPVRQFACAVLANNGAFIDETARSDRYIEASWYTTLILAISPSVTQSLVSTDEVYELGLEMRYLGGAEEVGIPPYYSVLLGNEKLVQGANTPHLLLKLGEQLVLSTEARRAEIWNSGLTAKLEDVSSALFRAVEGMKIYDGSTVEIPGTEWLTMQPVINPLTNPAAETDVLNWTKEAVTGVSSSDLARFTAGAPTGYTGYFQMGLSANTNAETEIGFAYADDLLAVSGRNNVTVGLVQASNDPTASVAPCVWFYDENENLISRVTTAHVENPTSDWFRRVAAVAVPEAAVYYRVGVVLHKSDGGATASYDWTGVEVNDTELALMETNPGTVALSARWKNRRAYNG